MAAGGAARVGRSDRGGQVRARHAHGVVEAEVDDHVVLAGHVTRGAERPRARRALVDLLVEMVGLRVVGVGAVAAGAQLVAVLVPLGPVHVVAVPARDVVRVHLALDEGVVLVVLVEDLAIRPESARAEQHRQVAVEQGGSRKALVGDLGAAGVARGAEADDLAVREVRGPRDQREVLHLGPGHRGLVGPRRVAGARSVAGLAADHDLRPGRLEGVGGRIVALADGRRVAVRAHGVPVLRLARPVQPVGRRDLLAGVEEEPAPGAGVPRDGEALQAPAGEGDQVLLQGIDAEGVGDLVLVQGVVRALGQDQELPAAPEEAPGLPPQGKRRVVEIAEHRALAGGLHRELVVGSLPLAVGALVAGGAALAADVERLGRSGEARSTERSDGEVERRGQHDRGQGREAHEAPAPERIALRRVGGRRPALELTHAPGPAGSRGFGGPRAAAALRRCRPRVERARGNRTPGRRAEPVRRNRPPGTRTERAHGHGPPGTIGASHR